MSEINKLQEALLNIELEEAEYYEKGHQIYSSHKFSRRYLKRREKIIRMYENGLCEREKDNDYKKAYIAPVRLRVILVAALIMLLATVSVIAITKPHIYYVIKEKIKSWDISFSVEDDEHPNNEFIAVTPKLPDGFDITMEEQSEIGYFVMSENQDGEYIDFEQSLADGLTVSIDTERSSNELVSIDGVDILLSRENNNVKLVFNDGTYIYQLDGNVEEQILQDIMQQILVQKK